VIGLSTQRTAWCAKCDGPQECDDRGCITCRILNTKWGRNRAASARLRRAGLLRDGLCINGAIHGAPMPGRTKCARCIETHRRSR
jgi:hypothetical protein